MMTPASSDPKQDFFLEETQTLGANEVLGWQLLTVRSLNVCHLICFQIKSAKHYTYWYWHLADMHWCTVVLMLQTSWESQGLLVARSCVVQYIALGISTTDFSKLHFNIFINDVSITQPQGVLTKFICTLGRTLRWLQLESEYSQFKVGWHIVWQTECEPKTVLHGTHARLQIDIFPSFRWEF